MKRFELIEHPSDAGFRAYGKNLSEAFENAALALFEIMTDTSKVKPEREVDVELSAEDAGALLYEWLDRLIALHDSENLLFSKFDVRIEKTQSELKLQGKAKGEIFDPKKHPERTAVKAMTYHMMEIHEEPEGYWIQAVVDI